LKQSDSRHWNVERSLRITASRAREVWKARKDKLKAFQGKPFSSKATEHGKRMEPKAKKTYADKYNCEVANIGLVVDKERPWLACSPDGLVREQNGDIYLLEIKCPHATKENILDQSYLKDGKLITSSSYYLQMQLQMFITKVKNSVLYIYTDNEDQAQKVAYNESFVNQAVTDLEAIMIEKITPHLKLT